MNDLRMLIARLGWPSTSVRWWTIQELAARLGEPATRAETEYSLLLLMSSRKLEAEVVEVLCIFWMATKAHSYSPNIALGRSIFLSSPLSDLLVKSCGLSIESNYGDLEVAPGNFKIPDDFNGVQGVDLPRIFHTTMNRLDTYTKLPFIRQMAFEWTKNRAAYPDAPYQGDSGHFIRPLGDSFIGLLSTRASIRAISAYLRTLAVAEQYWGMPTELMEQKSLLALPIHPTLAFIKPKRPNWFPTAYDFDGDNQAIENSLHALISRVEAEHPGDELIAFNSPVAMSMERCIEVSLVRWLQTVSSDAKDTDLTTHLESLWTFGQEFSSRTPEPLSTTTFIKPMTREKLINEDCKAWPLAGTLDLERIGYLQHDLYPSRIFLPTMLGADEIEITPNNGQLQAKVKDQIVAELCYWNVGWGPARPRQFGGNCGTALISRGTEYRAGAGAEGELTRAFYLWQVRTLSRSNSYDKFNETLLSGVLFV